MQLKLNQHNKDGIHENEIKTFKESNQLRELRKRLDYQKNTINELVQLVKQSKTNNYVPQFNQQIINERQEHDDLTQSLLEEVKQLRKQINNIENGPRLQQQQQQQPIFIPQYLPAPPQQQQQQQPFIYPYYPYYNQQKKKQDPYKKIVLQMLLKNNDQKSLPLRKQDSNDSYDSQDSYYNQRHRKHHKKTNRTNRTDRNDRQDNYHQNRKQQPKESRKHSQDKRDSDYNDQYSRRSQISRQSNADSYISNKTKKSNKNQGKKEFNDEEKLKLKRKLIGLFWFVRLGLVLRKFLKKIWIERRDIFYKNEAQNMIDKFDSEFNYKEVLILFYVECNKNKYFSKNWVFFDQQDIDNKCKIICQICTILFKKMPFLTKNTFTQEHKQFIKKISMPNGYLLSGHPQFVTDRVELRTNVTIGPITEEVSKMIQMDYVYIQVIVIRIIMIHEWYSQFSKIPNHKDAMKILGTTLHQLFIDEFINLPIIQNPDIIYNTLQINYCDFNQFNYVDVVIQIDDKHQKYQATTNACILGLGTKEEMQPLYDNPAYQELRNTFKQYYDYFYTSINE